MNILIVGSGAREHAIAQTLQRSPQEVKLYCCGTTHHPALKAMMQAYAIEDITDTESIQALAKHWQIDLAIIGPEAPLAAGLADALIASHIPTIGPCQNLAQIETSKSFARHLMHKYRIPGLPRFKVFNNNEGLSTYLQSFGNEDYVIKANGLMGGKGVKIAGEHLHSLAEALHFCNEIFAHQQSVIVEEKLIGQEFSFMCFCDGNHLIPMPLVQDHKRAYEKDRGPNTGGMGSYSAADHSLPFLQPQEVEEAFKINKAIIQALKKEFSQDYIGILYGSFMATKNGLAVIEYNARFGDPESLNVLTLLETDFVAICQAMVSGRLAEMEVRFAPYATVCKYTAPEGYPDDPIKNATIDISAVKNKSCLYLAAVDAVEGVMRATGSRAAAYVGVADTIWDAEALAEREVCAIEGPLFHRSDIGTRALVEARIREMERLRTL